MIAVTLPFPSAKPESESACSIRACTKCGRMHSAKQCLACKKEYMAKYYAANAEKAKEAAAAYRRENPQKILDIRANYYALNSEKVKAGSAKYRMLNPEKVSQTNRRYAAKTVEKRSAYRRTYYAKNAPAIIAKTFAYQAANPEAVRAVKQNRRARKLANATGSKLSRGIALKLYELQRGRCACCGASLKAGYHVDHIIPLSRGGANSDHNIQLLTPACNMQKHAKDPIAFMRERGFLL